MTNKELTARINNLQAMKATLDRQQKEADALAETIKAELIKRNVGAGHRQRKGHLQEGRQHPV